MFQCDIREFGAVGDGVTLCTESIQRAIDAAGEHGGRVILTEGRYLTGMLRMRSGVELHLESDAVLLGSTNGYDFPEIDTEFWDTRYAPRFNRRCMIYGEGLRDIAITGRGVIDCQGHAYVERIPDGWGMWTTRRNTTVSPARMVFFIGCENVLVEDVTMREPAAGWSYWVCDCSFVHFHRIRIVGALDYPNADGIHINCCRDVTVSDCFLQCGDDTIIVRAYTSPLKKPTPCERVAVTNCTLISHSSAIRIGWYNDWQMRNCVFSNLVMADCRCGISLVLPEVPEDPGKRGSDQGDTPTFVENLRFDNIVIDRCYTRPIFVDVGKTALLKEIRGLEFSGIRSGSNLPPRFVGRPDKPLRDITLSDCRFDVSEQHTRSSDGSVLTRTSQPESPTFLHVDGLELNNTRFSVS